MNRRFALRQAAAWTTLALAASSRSWAAPAAAPAASAPQPWPELTIFIPAIAGDNWDQVGRALGSAMQAAGLVDKLRYENLGGKAGTTGLQAFIERYKGNPRALMVSGMSMLGGLAMYRTPVDLGKLAAVAQLTADPLIVAVPVNSPIQMVQDLAIRLHDPNFRATVVGGPAGGVDHMLLGMMVRSVQGHPERMTYLATGGGPEVRKALQSGQAQVGISAYSELRDALQGGAVRALAVSSRKTEFGLPALRETGINTVFSDWCGLFGAPGLNEEQTEALGQLVGRAVATSEWKNLVRTNQWQSAYQAGPLFKLFVDTELASARLVLSLLKLQG